MEDYADARVAASAAAESPKASAPRRVKSLFISSSLFFFPALSAGEAVVA
jgi:hypothetical protein